MLGTLLDDGCELGTMLGFQEGNPVGWPLGAELKDGPMLGLELGAVDGLPVGPVLGT